MKRLVLGVLALTMVLVCTKDVDAIGRRRARRSNYYSYNYSNYSTTNYGYSFGGENPQAVAEQKVALLARLGYGFHSGGYVGNFEGWGTGATAEAARYGTCNGANCQTARGSAVAWSEAAGTWFAINIW